MGERGSAGGIGDFYPRPLRGGRPGVQPRFPRRLDISIHALCEEGDAGAVRAVEALEQFLSTPSARRATGSSPAMDGPLVFLSTPSARRATFTGGGGASTGIISIHALCEEGDDDW